VEPEKKKKGRPSRGESLVRDPKANTNGTEARPNIARFVKTSPT